MYCNELNFIGWLQYLHIFGNEKIADNTGADPENVEPGGANSINYQTEPGGANLFFSLAYKGEQGGVRRVRPPLNPRL